MLKPVSHGEQLALRFTQDAIFLLRHSFAIPKLHVLYTLRSFSSSQARLSECSSAGITCILYLASAYLASAYLASAYLASAYLASAVGSSDLVLRIFPIYLQCIFVYQCMVIHPLMKLLIEPFHQAKFLPCLEPTGINRRDGMIPDSISLVP